MTETTLNDKKALVTGGASGIGLGCCELLVARGATLVLADIDDGNRPGKSREESAELREARKQIRLLQQENEVLRRAAAYLSQANLPGKGCTRS